MQQTGFGHHNDLVRWRLFAERDHLFCRTNFIGKQADGVGAFRVRDDRRVGIFFANFVNAARGKFDVDVTSALPQIHLATGPLHHPRAKVLVRNKENIPISRRSSHDLVGVTARANHVGLRFHPGAAIDIGDDIIILVGVLF
jgi:hypothetical protein